MSDNGQIIDLLQHRSERGLEALNRLTGLNWGTMPSSLVNSYRGNEGRDKVVRLDDMRIIEARAVTKQA